MFLNDGVISKTGLRKYGTSIRLWYSKNALVLLPISFWQSYDFISFRFPKEDSRCPTFPVVEGSRDLFHNVPLRTILHRWEGLEIRIVPVVRRCMRLARQSESPNQIWDLASRLLYSVNKRCDVHVQIVRWRGSLHLPAVRPVCQNNMTHRPPRARAGLLCAALHNKWMNRSLLFANCLPLIY